MTLFTIHENIKNILKEKNEEILNFYIFNSTEILQKFKNIISIPEKKSFFNIVKSDVNKSSSKTKEKNDIIKEYIKLLNTKEIFNLLPKNNFFNLLNNELKNEKYCDNCLLENTLFEDDHNNMTCSNCFSIFTKSTFENSIDDISRINISQKYIYDRKSHFKECMKQYQSKQNVIIPQKILDDIENAMEKNNLLGDKNLSRKKRFEKITKNHIMAYLKILNITYHNEN